MLVWVHCVHMAVSHSASYRGWSDVFTVWLMEAHWWIQHCEFTVIVWVHLFRHSLLPHWWCRVWGLWEVSCSVSKTCYFSPHPWRNVALCRTFGFLRGLLDLFFHPRDLWGGGLNPMLKTLWRAVTFTHVQVSGILSCVAMTTDNLLLAMGSWACRTLIWFLSRLKD